jgi:hypothetical protein
MLFIERIAKLGVDVGPRPVGRRGGAHPIERKGIAQPQGGVLPGDGHPRDRGVERIG